MSKKISRSVGIIYRLRGYLLKSNLIQLYHSLVYPYLTYCNVSWGHTYSVHLQSLYVLQKRCVRLINGAHFLSPSNPLFMESRLLKLEDINKLQLGRYIFKNPDIVQEFQRFHAYYTCNNISLKPNFQRLTLTQQSVNYRAPKTWNDIPLHIRNSPSISSFKRNFTTYLIRSYI